MKTIILATFTVATLAACGDQGFLSGKPSVENSAALKNDGVGGLAVGDEGNRGPASDLPTAPDGSISSCTGPIVANLEPGTPIGDDLLKPLLDILKVTSSWDRQLQIVKDHHKLWMQLGMKGNYISTVQAGKIISLIGTLDRRRDSVYELGGNLIPSTAEEVGTLLEAVKAGISDKAHDKQRQVCRCYAGRITNPSNIAYAAIPISTSETRRVQCEQDLVYGAGL